MNDIIQAVYVVGQVAAIAQPVSGYAGNSQLWELVGVFAAEQEAVDACRDRTYFVIGPIMMGQLAPHETVVDFWPSRFPIEGKARDPLIPGEADEIRRAEPDQVPFFYITKHDAESINVPMTRSRGGVTAYRTGFEHDKHIELVPVFLAPGTLHYASDCRRDANGKFVPPGTDGG